MDITKHEEYFNPDKLHAAIHIIGCGAIGSTVAENLTRLGINQIHLWDFDTVAPHNIANQMFLARQIGMPKVDAVEENLKAINPDLIVVKHDKGWTVGDTISGYIFLAVDSIELRKKIVQFNLGNLFLNGIFDFRMRLTDAQHYASDGSYEGLQTLLKTMNFSDSEANEATPLSACGTTLSLVTTVRMVVAAGVSNFINFSLTKKLNKAIFIDTKEIAIDTM